MQSNYIKSLYTAKQVNISICWFSKELKPNEWIQWIEAAIIGGKNTDQGLLAEAAIVIEKKRSD